MSYRQTREWSLGDNCYLTRSKNIGATKEAEKWKVRTMIGEIELPAKQINKLIEVVQSEESDW